MFFSFIRKYKPKKELEKINKQLKNNEICMLYWSHGEMGYTQSKEEIEDLELERACLERRKQRLESEV